MHGLTRSAFIASEALEKIRRGGSRPAGTLTLEIRAMTPHLVRFRCGDEFKAMTKGGPDQTEFSPAGTAGV